MQSHTLGESAALLGVSRAVVSALIAKGFVTPQRGPRREYRFSFQDMVLLRTAHALQSAQVPSQRIVRSLERLRASLPETMPLTGLRIAAIGREVVVLDGGSPWQAESGQMVLDFEAPATAAPAPTALRSARSRQQAAVDEAPSGRPSAADESFRRGVALERSDRRAAETAYRQAIAAEPTCADAYLNLGVLLGEAGRHADAAAIYRSGLDHCPHEALLHFNLGVALEDLHRADAAVAAYERCLQLDPGMADAHFNIARLHDEAGRAKRAIRHYSEYRRLRMRG